MAERNIDPKFNIHENYKRVNIVNPYRYAGGGGSAHEPETVALMASIGWADDTTSSPHNGLTYAGVYNVLDTYFAAGKTDGWLPLLKAAYLFIGNNADNHKWNAVNPQDTDAAHRMTWFGSGSFSANGFKGNATDAYGNTNLTPFQHLEDENESFGFYSRTNEAGSYIDIGVVDGSINSRINGWWGNNSVYWRVQSGSFIQDPMDNSLGLYGLTILGSTILRQRNNSLLSAPAGNSTAANRPFYLGASNSDGTINAPSNREYCYAFAGLGMTNAQMSAHYNAVQQLQIDLGRNV